MPTYAYSTPDGEVIERDFPRGEAPDEILLGGGVTARRDYHAELGYRRRNAGSGWPMTCFASGVHPSQAGELRDYLAKQGVPTEVNRNGDPIYRDAHHRKRALKARGMYDRYSFT
jgi:hypothetical protein